MKYMFKSFLLISIATLVSCSQKKCELAEREYRNNLYEVNRELSNPVLSDSSFHKELAFARSFVKDSLKSRVECFQYNHNAWDSETYAIELYDKRLVIEEYDEFLDTTFYRLNHVVNLIFDENRSFVQSYLVLDTAEEQESLSIDLK